jgi:hypothetical protein
VDQIEPLAAHEPVEGDGVGGEGGEIDPTAHAQVDQPRAGGGEGIVERLAGTEGERDLVAAGQETLRQVEHVLARAAEAAGDDLQDAQRALDT